MSDLAQERARLTEATLGVPYVLDGQPWVQRLQDPAREMPRLRGQTLVIHRAVQGLLVKYALQQAVMSPESMRAEILNREPISLRRLGSQLMQLHNGERLQRVGGNSIAAPGHSVDFMRFGNVCAGRTEESRSIGLHLHAAGFFTVKFSKGQATRDNTNEFIPADATDYMDAYAPALPPQPGEVTASMLARKYGLAIPTVVQFMHSRRGVSGMGVVRRNPKGGEVVYYLEADFTWPASAV